MINGALYKYVPTPNHPCDYKFEWKLVVPPEERDSIIKESHNQSMHIGVEKTLAKIRQKYHWPRLTLDVKEYIKNCVTCNDVKAANVPVIPKMGEQRIVTHPWQIIAADYIGPLPRSKSGNQYILVVMDLFSKWVMLTPVRKISSGGLCSILKSQWFSRFSTPETIITDNASVFLSREFKLLLERFQIRHWLNAKYHSQANPVERVNRTINAAIRTYVKTDQRLWDSRLAEIETVINTTVHSGTELTPFFVIHGHEAFLKGTDHSWFTNKKDPSPEQRVEVKKELFQRIYDLVKTNLEKAHNSGKALYDSRHKKSAEPFHVGQTVYRRNMKQSSASERYNAKYGPMYLAARVKARVGNSSYELEDTNGKNLGVWPAAHLKPG